MAVIAPTPLFRSVMNGNNPENNNLLKKLYAVTAEHHPLVKTLIEDIFKCVNDRNSGFVPLPNAGSKGGQKALDLMQPVNRRKIMDAQLIGKQMADRIPGNDVDEMAAGAVTVRSQELEEERRAAMLKNKVDLK